MTSKLQRYSSMVGAAVGAARRARTPTSRAAARAAIRGLITELRPKGGGGKKWRNLVRRLFEADRFLDRPLRLPTRVDLEGEPRNVSAELRRAADTGPAAIRYRRIDPAGHLTRRPDPMAYPRATTSRSVRTVSGGLPTLGKR